MSSDLLTRLAKVAWKEESKTMNEASAELAAIFGGRTESMEPEKWEDADHEHFQRIARAVAAVVIEEAAKRVSDNSATGAWAANRIRSLLEELK